MTTTQNPSDLEAGLLDDLDATTRLSPSDFGTSEVGLVPADQWRAEVLQVINWGGFSGHNRIELDPTGTILSGPSGTGKSTLLDAITALLHTGNVPFNGASNGNLGGRARSQGQRTLLNYLRGKTDEMDSGDGEKVDKALRGNGRATWSAVSLTWVNDSGARFTALRYYYVPASAVASRDVSQRYATIKSAFDLSQLKDLVEEHFNAKAMKKAFPGLETRDSYDTFIHTCFAALGIGTGADGKRALALLATIQAAGAVTSVNDLFYQYVLERPETYEAADNAIEHFDQLEDMYQEMVAEGERLATLADIENQHRTYSTGSQEGDLIDALGADQPENAPTLFNAWLLALEEQLLDEAADENLKARTANTEELRTARASVIEADREYEEAVSALALHGRTSLVPLEQQVTRAEETFRKATDERARFAAAVGDEVDRASDAEAFAAWKAECLDFQERYETEQNRISEALDEVKRAQWKIEDERSTAKRELASLEGREGSIPSDLHELRCEMARAAGLDPVDLPFVAELIDIAEIDRDWRTAAEVVHYSLARTLLVEESFKAEFRRRIDGIRSRYRLSYDGAKLTGEAPIAGVPGFLSEKIVYKPGSKFAHAASLLITSRARDARCVPSASDFAEHGPDIDRIQVAPSGQTRSRTGGAHGGQNRPAILGFSNQAAISALQNRLRELTEQISPVLAERNDLENELRGMGRRADIARAVVGTDWVEIDVAGTQQAMSDARQALADLLASDDVLRDLNKRKEEKSIAQKIAGQAVLLAEGTEKLLLAEQEKLSDRKDDVVDALIALEDHPHLELTDAQRTVIETHAAAESIDLTDLAAVQLDARKRIRKALAGNSDRARSDSDHAKRLLETAFSRYLDRWPDPDLAAHVDCYPEFLEILNGIRGDGLTRTQENWRRAMAEWNGQDLMPLQRSVTRSVDTIKDRMRPINDILRNLDFSASRGYLQIHTRMLTRDPEVTAFKAQLRELAGSSTLDLTDEQIKARFDQVRAMIMKIRTLDDVRWRRAQLNGEVEGSNTRDRLLDVRLHVEVTAKRFSREDVEESTYAYLGNQSGGETQELVSFLIGSALRYHLGDDTRSLPKYAFVVIDEGFIKADSEFAGRAVQAWQQLGFQLLIGTPYDKHPGLEPYMPTTLLVTKSTMTKRSQVSRQTRRGTGMAGDPDLDGPLTGAVT